MRFSGTSGLLHDLVIRMYHILGGFVMKRKVTSVLCALICVLSLALTVGAATFGNSRCGASSDHYLELLYHGKCWVYSDSGYKWASFKYTRNGEVLASRKSLGGVESATVFDDLRWGDKYTTKFNWNRGN